MMPFHIPCDTTDARKQIPLSTNHSSLSSQGNFWNFSYYPNSICHDSSPRHHGNSRKRKRSRLAKSVCQVHDLNVRQGNFWDNIARGDVNPWTSNSRADQHFMTDYKSQPSDDLFQVMNNEDLLPTFSYSSPVSTSSQFGVSDAPGFEYSLSVFGDDTDETRSHDAASYTFPWQSQQGVEAQIVFPISDQGLVLSTSPRSHMASNSGPSGDISESSEVHKASLTTVSSPSKRYWTAIEDQQLLIAVSFVRETYDLPLPWGLVADAMEGRTAIMCSKRYRQLQCRGSEHHDLPYTRGSWTPEEDTDLMETVAEYKATSHIAGTPLPWTKIGSMLRQPRSGLQVCARYTEALDPSVIRGRWSKEEDTKLLEEYIRLAGRWSLICQQIEGRTQRQCASRYGVLMGKNKTRRDQ